MEQSSARYFQLTIDTLVLFAISTLAGFGYFWVTMLLTHHAMYSILLGCLSAAVASAYILVLYLQTILLKNKLEKREKRSK